MAELRLDGISLCYQAAAGETLALKNVSFSVGHGEFASLVGPSGCGKTTVLSIIAGLLPPTSGEVTVDGGKVVEGSGNVGYMLQRDLLFPWRTIEDNILLGLEIMGKLDDNSRSYAVGLAKKYGLGEFLGSYPSQLSGGMRQRAALIRTLAYKPQTLLLDEPFSALDYQTRLDVCEDVRAILRQENVTTLLVTHDISEAAAMSDKVVILSPRPSVVKRVLELKNLPNSPLKRRENAAFSGIFDEIYKEVRYENDC